MDIREILASLSDEDKSLWSQHRTEMRKSYLNATVAVLGVAAWNNHDDAFLDLIDIKLALIFDRGGRLEASKEIIGAEKAVKIEQQIHETKLTTHKKSKATELMEKVGS